MVGIYKIISPTNKIYIGQSWDIHHRWCSHRKDKRAVGHLASSLKKYGTNTHVFSVIHELPSDVEQAMLDKYEQLYIDQFRHCGFEMLNLREAGSRGKHSKESVEKMRASLMGNIPHNKGVPHTDETKAKMKERWTDERKEQRRKFMKGHTYNNGRKASEEHKKKLSASLRLSVPSGNRHYRYGKTIPENVRAAIINSNRSKARKVSVILPDGQQKIFDTKEEAAIFFSVKVGTIYAYCRLNAKTMHGQFSYYHKNQLQQS